MATMKNVSGNLPWTRGCFVCGENNPHGLQLRSRLENGRVVLNYTTREVDLGYRNIVHGGIAMALLDEVMTWACIVAARGLCVAAEMTTRLKEAIEVGQSLRVEGEVTEQKPRLLFTKASILNDQGKKLASAVGKYVPMPRDKISLCSEDFVTSPEAISPDQLLE